MALKTASSKYPGVWINELKNGNIAYYINYRDENNRPVKKKVGTKTKQSNFTIKDAYDRLIEIKNKLNLGEELPKEINRKNQKTLNDIWEIYIKWAEANKKSWNIDKYYYDKHVKNALGNKRIRSIKSLDFEDLKSKKLDEGYADQTVKHILQVCRRSINFVISHEVIKNFTNPISNGKVQMPKIDNSREAFFNHKEAKELLDILETQQNKRSFYLAIFGLFTGARFGEITDLKWQDVNFSINTIFYKKNKNGNERHISISKPVEKCLKELELLKISNNSYVIPNDAGNRITRVPKQLTEAILKIRPNNNEETRKYKIVFHSLRHTHASWLAMDGLDILNIKEQLGHKTLEQTLRYSHLIPNNRHKKTEALAMLLVTHKKAGKR